VIPVLFLFLLFFAGCAGTAAPPAAPIDVASPSIETSLFLIGDAGKPAKGGEPVLEALARMAGDRSTYNVVLFLGDNVYPAGVPDSTKLGYDEAVRRLTDQIDAVKAAGCRGIFIPGNHDWAHHQEDGWNAILREGAIVDAASDSLTLLPPGGCPGPSVVDFPGLRLVLIDTQWWLHTRVKPVGPDSGCPEDQPDEVLDAMRKAIAGAGDRAVVVAGHHPLLSGGEHGGHFGWKDHVFPLRIIAPWMYVPLPILGSAYPIARRSGYSHQDLSNPTYEAMRDSIESVFRDTTPLAYASGHEHNLQVLAGRAAPWYLVSGAGLYNHATPVHALRETRFKLSDAGFMRLDVLRDGRVRLDVYSVDGNGRAILRDARWLQESPRTDR